MKEKLQEYALIAEIVSAFAVVASLIFVGLEIRNSSTETELNTRAIEIGAYQDLISQLGSMNTLLINNPQLLELDRKIFNGGNFENEIEEHMYVSYVRILMRNGDMAYQQYRAGLITEFQMRPFVAPFIESARNVELSMDMLQVNQLLDPNFRDYVLGFLQ